MERLTEEQQVVLQAIINYIDENAYSPSVRELCEMTGKKSPATIEHHLKNLKEKGYISYKEQKSRTIRVLKENE